MSPLIIHFLQKESDPLSNITIYGRLSLSAKPKLSECKSVAKPHNAIYRYNNLNQLFVFISFL